MQSESENEIDETKQDVEATIFKIAVMRRVWTQIMELIDTDGRSLEKFKLKPDYVRFFQAELTAYENMPIALRDRKTRVYNLKKENYKFSRRIHNLHTVLPRWRQVQFRP